MAWAAVAAIAAPIIGGMLGNAASAGDRDRANQLSRTALEAIQGIRVPTPEEQRIILEELKRVGVYTPDMEVAYQQPDSEMKSISTDPRLKQAQLNSLLKLQEIGSEGGMSMEDRARTAELTGELARQEQGQREAIIQNMAQRGVSGSGFELASQLTNQQGSATRASQQGMDIKAQAEKRALEALMSAGTLGGQIQSQDFSQQAQIAEAQDAINRFNTQNRQDVQARNVTSTNDGKLYNLDQDQKISDANVGTRNQQQVYNKELNQQYFRNQMDKGAALAGQYQNQAQRADASADRTQQMYTGAGQGIGQGAAAYGQYQVEDERLKKYGRTK